MDTQTERGFGDRLDELMRADGRYGARGQSKLAEDSHVPQPTISRALKKASAPEMETVVRLAKVFGVTCEWLLTERGPKYIRDMRFDHSVNPGANVTDPDSDEVISVLIKRLQLVYQEVSEVLSIAQGYPVETVSRKESHDMNIASIRRDAEATQKLIQDRHEGKGHGKQQPRRTKQTPASGGKN